MEVPRREPGNQTFWWLSPFSPPTFFPTRAPFSFPGSRLGTHGTRGSASVSHVTIKAAFHAPRSGRFPWRFPGDYSYSVRKPMNSRR